MNYINHEATKTSLSNCEVPISQFRDACLVSVATLTNLRSEWLTAAQNRYVDESDKAELLECLDKLISIQRQAADEAHKTLSCISLATGHKIIGS